MVSYEGTVRLNCGLPSGKRWPSGCVFAYLTLSASNAGAFVLQQFDQRLVAFFPPCPKPPP